MVPGPGRTEIDITCVLLHLWYPRHSYTENVEREILSPGMSCTAFTCAVGIVTTDP